jgi:hypothetical protein
MKFLYSVLASFVLIVVPMISQAQCAMCRTQVVNNVSQGDTTLAAGLNTGILYLFFTPYVAIGVVAFLWFRNARVNERKRTFSSRSTM